MKIRLLKIYTKKRAEDKTINGQTKNVLITKIIIEQEYQEGEIEIIEIMYNPPSDQMPVYKKVITLPDLQRITMNYAYRCCVYDKNKSIQSLVKENLYTERILPKNVRKFDDNELFSFVYNNILFISVYSLSRKHKTRLEKILDRVRGNN